MALSTEDLFEKALTLSGDVEDNFLELGKSLRQLQDRDSELFHKIVAKTNLGRRKAYYLVEVSRIFDPLPVPRSRLREDRLDKTPADRQARHGRQPGRTPRTGREHQFQGARTPDAG